MVDDPLAESLQAMRLRVEWEPLEGAPYTRGGGRLEGVRVVTGVLWRLEDQRQRWVQGAVLDQARPRQWQDLSLAP